MLGSLLSYNRKILRVLYLANEPFERIGVSGVAPYNGNVVIRRRLIFVIFNLVILAKIRQIAKLKTIAKVSRYTV